jgi:hypothetical protein
MWWPSRLRLCSELLPLCNELLRNVMHCISSNHQQAVDLQPPSEMASHAVTPHLEAMKQQQYCVSLQSERAPAQSKHKQHLQSLGHFQIVLLHIRRVRSDAAHLACSGAECALGSENLGDFCSNAHMTQRTTIDHVRWASQIRPRCAISHGTRRLLHGEWSADGTAIRPHACAALFCPAEAGAACMDP